MRLKPSSHVAQFIDGLAPNGLNEIVANGEHFKQSRPLNRDQ